MSFLVKCEVFPRRSIHHPKEGEIGKLTAKYVCRWEELTQQKKKPIYLPGRDLTEVIFRLIEMVERVERELFEK